MDSRQYVEIIVLSIKDCAAQYRPTGTEPILRGAVGRIGSLEPDTSQDSGLIADIKLLHNVAGGNALFGPVAAGISCRADNRVQRAAMAQGLHQIGIGESCSEFCVTAAEIIVARCISLLGV